MLGIFNGVLKMIISKSKHKEFKIINSKHDNKFILRLFNFEYFDKRHHKELDLKDNKVFILDLKFNSIKDIYTIINSNYGINNLKNNLYNNWYFNKNNRRAYDNKFNYVTN